MADLTVAEAHLIRGLFVPRERWGWQFVDVGPPVPSPAADRRPVWREPEPPDLTELTARRARAVRALWTRLLLPVTFVVLGLLLLGTGGLYFVLAGLTLALVAALPAVVYGRALRRARSRAAAERAERFQRHRQATADWSREVGTHERAEELRRATADVFFPVSAPAAAARVDVFGGSGDGWASLLATAGSSVLSTGSGILLVDLSERTVGGGLARLAAEARWPVESWELPGQIDEVGLLDGLEPQEAGELLADAFEPTGPADDDPHRRGLHADLLTTVSWVLRGSLSPHRLATGLRILEGLDDGSGGALTPAEVAELSTYLDAFGHGDRVTDELRFLRSSLAALAPPPPPGARDDEGWWPGWSTGPDAATGDRAAALPPGVPGPPGPPGPDRRRLSAWWPVQGLRVLATSSRASSARRKELADRVLVQAVLHRLRHRRPGSVIHPDLLVVAGADGLGRVTLEALARHAEIAGVRLVLFFERLADDAERLLGSQGGSTIIMRLGNARDATTAAEFIGRGHRFVLSQVTSQVGRSFTTGDGESVGDQDGTSWTSGTSGGRGRTYDGTRILPWLQNTSTNTGWQDSVTTSRSRTWQRTTNHAVSDSTTDGTTTQRVYEFAVEPTTVQTLPTTAFLLVNPVDGPGRVVPGDCNPGIVLLPRVAAGEPGSAAPQPARAAPPVPVPARAVYGPGRPVPSLAAGGDADPPDDEIYRIAPSPAGRPARLGPGDQAGVGGWTPTVEGQPVHRPADPS